MTVDFEYITKVLAAERPKQEMNHQRPFERVEVWTGLTVLPPNFFDEVNDHLDHLEKCKAESNDIREREFLGDEIIQTRLLLEGIVDRRLAKITEYAAIAAAGAKGGNMEINKTNMLPVEREAFDNMVAALEKVRWTVYRRAP